MTPVTFRFLFQFLTARIRSDGENKCSPCSTFLKILEVVTNGILKLGENATYAQRVPNKLAKKKYCKAAYYIQLVVDSANFDKSPRLNRRMRHEIFLSNTMNEVRKSKSSNCILCDDNMNYCRREKMKIL
ncbi:hypothetical protein KIW84_051858 [Lathyrus oleraceus]|uniref:Uncharacterized protein n=1 Tax=Pisum sativum TaxID=3888 RepID=A0A9D4WL54_PEA|nr:hypothetical protein KIW84_051858 [Pisum sativum]